MRSNVFIEKSNIRNLNAIETAVCLVEEQAKEKQEHDYKNFIEQLTSEKDILLNEIKGQHCEEIRKLEIQAKLNLQRAIEEGNKRLVKVLNDKKILMEEKERALRENHIAVMEKQTEINKKHIEHMKIRYEESLKRKIKEVEDSFADRQNILAKDYQTRLSQSLASIEAQSKLSIDESIKNAKIESDRKIEGIRSNHEIDKKHMESKHLNHIAKVREEVGQEMKAETEKRIEDVKQKAEQEIKSRLDEQKTNFEKIKFELVAHHKVAIKEAIASNKMAVDVAVSRERQLKDKETSVKIENEILKVQTQHDLAMDEEKKTWEKVRH